MMNHESNMPEKRSLHRSFLPAFLRRNFTRKAVAVFLAALLYYYVQDQLGAEARFSKIPVEIDLPGMLHNADYIVPSVTVVITGSTAKLNELSASDIRIRAAVSMDDYTPGSPYILRLQPRDVKLPSGLKVERIEPSDIQLPHLEPMVTRRVPVAAEWSDPEGRHAEYSVQVQFVPESVAVSGPESVVRTIKEVKTVPIPLDWQATDQFSVAATLLAPPDVEMSVAKVEAHIEVLLKYTSRTFKKLPVMVMDDSRLTPRRVQILNEEGVEVTVNGPPSQVTLMRDVQLCPYVDISGIREAGEYQLAVECRMPDDVESAVKRVFPSKVKVKIAEP